MARSLMYLFLAGATLTLAPLLVPHAADGLDQTRILVTSGCGYAMAFVLLVGYDRMPPWSFQVFLAASTMLVEWAIYGSRDETSPYAAFYFWIAIYAFYFFTRAQAILQILFIVCAYAAVLGFVAEPTSTPVLRWAITTSALVVAGAMIGLLQDRVARLARAMRHDPATGLLNRRGFYELLDTDLERARRSSNPLTVVVGHIDDFDAVASSLGRGVDRVFERVANLLQDTKRGMDRAARLGRDEFALIVADADEHGAYILAERLRHEVRATFEGEDPKITLSFGLATFPKHGATAEAVVHAGEQAVYASKQLGRDRSVIYSPEIAGIVLAAQGRRDGESGGGTLAAVLALAEVLDIRDGGTAEHSQTVGRFAEMIARRLELPAELVKRIRLAGILHDVGKIAVPDSVLRKPGPLNDEEWAEMRRHPEIGAMILEGADLRDIASWVRAHHERPDGRGYPYGLSGRDIPLEARILAVADSYEAMIADRVYRPGMPPAEARAELRRYSGQQFDARVAEVFCDGLEEMDELEAIEAAQTASTPA